MVNSSFEAFALSYVERQRAEEAMWQSACDAAAPAEIARLQEALVERRRESFCLRVLLADCQGATKAAQQLLAHIPHRLPFSGR